MGMASGGGSVTQNISSYGDGCIIVQVDGDGNHLSLNTPVLTLSPRHKYRRDPKTPLEVLNAFACELPLQGRVPEMALLRDWLSLSAPISVRCLIGPAGCGKSRLGLELCAQAEALGWRTGFVTHDELERFAAQPHLAQWGWSQPILAVVDYAAAKSAILKRWVGLLAEREATSRYPLRLLLLERHAQPDSGWWGELVQIGGAATVSAVRRMFADPLPVSLGGLSAGEQRAALAGAVIRVAAPLVRPGDDGSRLEQDFLAGDSLDRLGNPLDVAMAALASVHDNQPIAARHRTDVAFLLAGHERHRLDVLARDRNLDAGILNHAAALVTLCGAMDWDNLRQALAVEAKAEDWAGGVRAYPKPLLDILATGQADRAQPLQPDLIGEAFVLTVLEKNLSPASRRQAVLRWHERNPLAVQDALIRTLQDFGDHPLAAQAEQWLSVIIERQDLSALTELADQLPEHTVDLRPLSAKVVARIKGLAEERLRDDPADLKVKVFVATAANNLANRLGDLGRRDEALMVAWEAVALFRDLAKAYPAIFTSTLATTLNTLANRLSDVGQSEAALEVARESVGLFRGLKSASPDIFTPDLSYSLNNFANRLSDAKQPSAALAASREAVALLRDLVATRPDSFTQYLASALNNFANYLSDAGQDEAALVASREAVAFYRDLGARHPDAFIPRLAMTLHTLALLLNKVGQPEVGLKEVQEAITLRRDLALVHPDFFTPHLALSVSVKADLVEAVEGASQALPLDHEAVTLLAPYFVANPAAFRSFMMPIFRSYWTRCQQVGQSPDPTLLAPIFAAFKQMENQGGEDG